jgi:hypothetical protein
MGLFFGFWCTSPRLDVADDGLAAHLVSAGETAIAKDVDACQMI